MRNILGLLAGITLLVPAGFALDEPKTGKTFEDTLTVDGTTLQCTGASYRSKFGFKVYAVAHYGDPAAAPKGGSAEDKLKHWQTADAAKAYVLKFVRDVDAGKIQEAWTEALDAAKYEGSTRSAFLAAFNKDCAADAEMRIIALPGGTLRASLNGKQLGEWKDPALVSAMWPIWMGETTVVAYRDDLVSR